MVLEAEKEGEGTKQGTFFEWWMNQMGLEWIKRGLLGMRPLCTVSSSQKQEILVGGFRMIDPKICGSNTYSFAVVTASSMLLSFHDGNIVCLSQWHVEVYVALAIARDHGPQFLIEITPALWSKSGHIKQRSKFVSDPTFKYCMSVTGLRLMRDAIRQGRDYDQGTSFIRILYVGCHYPLIRQPAMVREKGCMYAT
jgi:hypothetical protein